MSQATRIRYKTKDTMLTSPELLGGTDLFIGVIDTTTRTASVQRKVEGEFTAVRVSNYDSLTTAKKFIKDSLKSVGVSFYEEVRKKKETVFV